MSFPICRFRGKAEQRGVSAKAMVQFINALAKQIHVETVSLGDEPRTIEHCFENHTYFFSLDGSNLKLLPTKNGGIPWAWFWDAWDSEIGNDIGLLTSSRTRPTLGELVAALLYLPGAESKASGKIAANRRNTCFAKASYLLEQIAVIVNDMLPAIVHSWKHALQCNNRSAGSVKKHRLDCRGV